MKQKLATSSLSCLDSNAFIKVESIQLSNVLELEFLNSLQLPFHAMQLFLERFPRPY